MATHQAADEARELARQVHADGFVALASDRFRVPSEQVEAVRSAVLQQYEQLLSQATDAGIDLALPANAEVVPGFYVRQGGRVDMQLKRAALGPAAAKKDQALLDCEAQVTDMASIWADVVREIFRDQDEKEAKYALEYVGCVLARPGDADQNWHLDGVHRNPHEQEPVDRLNVFVPLVALTEAVGGTEMKQKSHFHENGKRGPFFRDYEHLPSITHLVQEGTPVVMDYRVWHRGLANTSENTIRPLLYFKYVKQQAASAPASKRPETSASGTAPAKKRKRIVPVQVQSSDS